jgi:hypothetical protein
MDDLFRRDFLRFISGTRFCDRHPRFTTCVISLVVLGAIGCIAGSLSLGIVGALRCLGISSVCDHLLPSFRGWAVMISAVALWGLAYGLLAVGIVLYRRWV